MKQPIKFVIGNIMKNTSLIGKLSKAQRDGYRVVSTSGLRGVHPGVMVFVLQLVDSPITPFWTATYAKRPKA